MRIDSKREVQRRDITDTAEGVMWDYEEWQARCSALNAVDAALVGLINLAVTVPCWPPAGRGSAEAEDERIRDFRAWINQQYETASTSRLALMLAMSGEDRDRAGKRSRKRAKARAQR